MRIKSLEALSLSLMLSSQAAAVTFEFVAEHNEVIPVLWNYREVATHKVLGCRQWDVLQGTGWFQATWYTDYTPTADQNVYTVQLKQKLGPKICAAKMDAYNSVRVEAGSLRGSFSVNPDGLTSETTITCRPDPEGSAYDNLACDEAHVAVPNRGVVRIHLRYEDEAL